MPKQKKSVKAAEKALAKASIAVADAQRAVKTLDKKTRRKAEALRQELRDTEKAAKKALKRADAATAPSTERLERLTVQPTAVLPDGQPHVADDASPTATASPTYRDLREQAKVKGIVGYSRMDKAALLTALATSQ